MVYGEYYQRYGAGVCPRCNVPHAMFLTIKETARSRFKLLQFNAELMAQFSRPPTIFVGAKQKFMTGILISGNDVLVAASGSNNRRIEATANLKGYTLCPEIHDSVGHISRVGAAIPTLVYQSTHRAGASQPGLCAAPRLIQHAFSIPDVRSNWRNWEMSEIFYQPNTKRRTQDNLVWAHGLSAPHCATCDSLIALLMCTRPAE